MDDLIKKYQNSDIRKEFNVFKQKVKGFTDTNTEMNLKTGDVISIFAGYNDDINYKTEILGFSEEGHAFVLWDCYWVDVNLKDPKRKFKKL